MGISGRPGYHRATVVGGGVIGISWTALFLAHGLEVTVCDPLPDVAERVRAGLREIAPTLAQLGLPVDDLTNGTDALGSTRTRPAPPPEPTSSRRTAPNGARSNSSCGRRSRPAPRRTPCSPPPPPGSPHRSWARPCANPAG